MAVDAECRALVDVAMSAGGRVDALVNGAGTMRFVPHRDLDAIRAEDWQRMFAVKVMGAFQMARAGAPSLRASDRGAIVNISSVSGALGDGSCIPNAASKGALDTLTKSLARALAPEIWVNAVAPDYLTGRWLLEGVGAERYEAVMTASARTRAAGRRRNTRGRRRGCGMADRGWADGHRHPGRDRRGTGSRKVTSEGLAEKSRVQDRGTYAAMGDRVADAP